MTRRALLQKVLVGGLAAPVLGLLTACGDDEGTNSPDAGSANSGDEPIEEDEAAGEDSEPTGEARRGGEVRVGTAGAVDTLDPHLQVTLEESWPIQEMFSGLARLDVELAPEPDLALSWESNEAGDEWTFELRTGVLFHNGREFKAEDVVESFTRLLDPDLGSQYAAQLQMIGEIEAPDEETAVFHLDTPYGGFAVLLANYFTKIIPIEEADNLATAPVGTGPYQLEQQVPGERTVLTRFDDFWDADQRGFVDSIQFIVMPEETSRITALTGGEIELIVDVAGSSIPMIEGAEQATYEEVDTPGHITVIMMYDQEPWNDERVRTALKLCLDREKVVQAALQGFGVVAADQPVPPIDPMYPDLPIPEQDIDRARELLAEAGYPDGIDLELHTSAGRIGMQETALAVQEMAEPAGFRIELQSHPIDQYWTDYWMQVPFHTGNWNGIVPSDKFLQLCYVTGGAWNESNWSSEEFDELIQQAQQSIDDDERYDYQRQACQLLAEKGAVCIPFFRSGLDVRHQRLQGTDPHPTRMFLGLDRVWIED